MNTFTYSDFGFSGCPCFVFVFGFVQRQSAAKYINNYDFPYRLSGPLGNTHADFTMTSVLGHLTSSVSEPSRELKVLKLEVGS